MDKKALRPSTPPPPKKGAHRPPVVRRQDAMEELRRKFGEKTLKWGRVDCIVVFRSHLVYMGHKGIPRLPKYRTALEAKRALKEVGKADSIVELVDKYLERIPPAAMLLGDIAAIPSDDDVFGQCLIINAGYKFWGWHPDVDQYAILDVDPNNIIAAWRV